MQSTAARLKVIETQDPRRMPVMTVNGRIREYYAGRPAKYPQQLIFGEYALDRKPHAI